MEQHISETGRTAVMRNTLYQPVGAARREAAFDALPLAEVNNTLAGKKQRSKRLATVAEEPVRLVNDPALWDQVVLMAACD